MSEQIAILILNVIATPAMVIITLWVKSLLSSKERIEKREDGFINGLEKRVLDLEREVKEVRVELKNRDKEYFELYKEHTTLKAKYEVLVADYDELKKENEEILNELIAVKESLKECSNNIHIPDEVK